MSGLTVRVSGADTIARKLRRFWPPTRKKLRSHIASTTHEMVAQAKGRANNASVASQISASYADDGFTGIVESGHPASAFREYGTRPHIIRPVRKKMLKFNVPQLKGTSTRGGSGDRVTFIRPSRRGGYTIYTTRVDHPGTRPVPFMKPAFDSVQKRFMSGLKRILG